MGFAAAFVVAPAAAFQELNLAFPIFHPSSFVGPVASTGLRSAPAVRKSDDVSDHVNQKNEKHEKS